MAKRQAQASRPVDIEVVDAPASTDQSLITTSGDKLRTFLGGMSTFFKRAGEIERAAKERLERVRLLKPPAPGDAAADEKLQIEIRTCRSEIKVAEEHWLITTAIHDLHRLMTSARGRTTGKDSKGNAIGMLDQAQAIAQRLHNDYVDAENRRVRAEEDRIRREREETARQEQERQAAQLEADAVKAEESSPELSERERQFVDRVHAGATPQRAAEAVGFRDALKTAARLTSSPKIQAALKAKEDAERLRNQATATREMPVEIEAPQVTRNVTRVAGGFDRSSYSAVVDDPDAFIAAVLDPRTRTTLGIPTDVVTFDQTKMNDYAKSMKTLIEKWPGVRLKKSTTTV